MGLKQPGQTSFALSCRSGTKTRLLVCYTSPSSRSVSLSIYKFHSFPLRAAGHCAPGLHTILFKKVCINVRGCKKDTILSISRLNTSISTMTQLIKESKSRSRQFQKLYAKPKSKNFCSRKLTCYMVLYDSLYSFGSPTSSALQRSMGISRNSNEPFLKGMAEIHASSLYHLEIPSLSQ